MKHFATLTCVIVVLASARVGSAAAFDWPQWQGPDRNAISRESGLLQEWPKGGPRLAWKATDLGGGDRTPSIAAGRIFGMSNRGEEEVVWALSEKDGQEIWVKRLGPAYQQGMSQSKEGPGCTPTVDDDRLYVLGLGGTLSCLKVKDGSMVWQRSLTKEFGGLLPTWSYRESPLIDGDKVICTPGGTNTMMVALNKMTGETIWECRVKADPNSTAWNMEEADPIGSGTRALLSRLKDSASIGQRILGLPAPQQGETAAAAPKPVSLIAAGSSWKYFDKGSSPGSGWTTRNFDDAAWPEGAAQLGYGDGDEKTKINDDRDNYPTYYFRLAFEVRDPARLKPLILRLVRDDGAVVYINGNEVWRDNMPSGTVQHDTYAAGSNFAENEFYLHDVGTDRLVAGRNVIAVEVHQSSATSSDVSFDLELREKVPGVDVVRSAAELRRSRFGRGRGRGGRGRSSSGAAYSSAIVIDFEGQRQYVQLTATSLIGVDASSGELLWRYDNPANNRRINCSTPLFHDGHVFAASAYGNGGGLARLSKDGAGGISANQVWFSKEMENHHGGVVLIDGALYGANGGNGGGYLACLDFKTGEVLWDESERDKRRVRKGSLVVADKRIYYRTERGEVILIEPNRKEYIERGRFDQPDRTRKPAWAHPVVANGKLYIRDQDVLLCYDVKAK